MIQLLSTALFYIYLWFWRSPYLITDTLKTCFSVSASIAVKLISCSVGMMSVTWALQYIITMIFAARDDISMPFMYNTAVYYVHLLLPICAVVLFRPGAFLMGDAYSSIYLT